jgi:hypothetical protein
LPPGAAQALNHSWVIMQDAAASRINLRREGSGSGCLKMLVAHTIPNFLIYHIVLTAVLPASHSSPARIGNISITVFMDQSEEKARLA